MDFTKIKVVIWDLDDTFWKGTLSEGGVSPIRQNIELVKKLTDRGVVNTICSKNDHQPVIDKLREFAIKDYFVFPSVDWTPKGMRISVLLKDMGLRPVNALFIDDNIVNLNEAKHYEPELLVAEPNIISKLYQYFSTLPATDEAHRRLDNYKLLEKKKESRNSFSDNESFLYASNTQVTICKDCCEEVDRIYELIQRTNQLNFTKVRSTKAELEQLIEDRTVNSGYVKVRDKFGDYGIVGFYAIRNNKCIHFLFSCRTIGQGVEQYVYAALGYPQLEISGIVINNVTQDPAPAWINQEIKSSENNIEKANGKIVFRGPCDLMGLTSYLKADDIVCELTYISETRCNNLEHQGCITNYLQIPKLSSTDLDILVNRCIFNDEKMFRTSIYNKDVRLIFISSLQEFHFGIYKHKTRGIKIAFGEWNHPLTDRSEWDNYIFEKVWTSSNKFTQEFLEEFTRNWEFLGRKEYDEYITELEQFMDQISLNAHVCIFLGSEIPYSGETTDAWKDRHLVHREINRRLREFASNNSRIHLIDYTELITSEKDYTDSIDHMQRYIHFKAAEKANGVIFEVLGSPVKQSGRFKIVVNRLRDVFTNIHVKYINYRNERRQKRYEM